MLKSSAKTLKSKKKDTKSSKPLKNTLSTKRQKSKDPLPKPSENAEVRKTLSKKPPLFKKSSIDIQKPQTPKTPKHPKGAFFGQTVLSGHQVSDLEKSCKIFDKNRARSNLEQSLKTKLDLSQKILAVKNTSPHRVDHIIKLSLRKGRRDRILKEKEIKQKKLQDNIKKLEKDYQNNLIRKINLQKFKVKKSSPEGTGRGYAKEMLEICKKIIKGKCRSVSAKRSCKEDSRILRRKRNSFDEEELNGRSNSAEKLKKVKSAERNKHNSIENIETYREKSFLIPRTETIFDQLMEEKRTFRNISYVEPSLVVQTDIPVPSMPSFLNKPEESTAKQEELPINPNIKQAISTNYAKKYQIKNQKFLKALKTFKENRAARVIQRAYLAYMERKREQIQSEQKKSKLQEIVQEQLGWREAQLLSLDYLKSKELEDLQSLLQLFGENDQLRDFIFNVVDKRYSQFKKVFKEDLETTEQAIIEDMDTLEVLDFSSKIRSKKDVVSKIIEGVNLNASLNKNDIENILKDVKDEVVKPGLTSTSCQTSSSIIRQAKKIVENVDVDIDEEYGGSKMGAGNEELDTQFNAPNTSPNLPRGKLGPKILNEIEELNLEQVSLNDILFLDPSVVSPNIHNTFNLPDSSSPRPQGCTSPIPERPSAPLMFLDTDDNISLESLLNLSTPLNKKSPQNLPLLNLNSISSFASNIPITSDPRIETSPRFIKSFLSKVLNSLDKPSLIQELSQGLTKNPLKEFQKIHEVDMGGLIEQESIPFILNIKKIVENFFDDPEEIQTTQRIISKADKIHKIMLLSVADEVLQKFRPYGLRGVPLIWSEKNRVLTVKKVEIKMVIEKVLAEIEEFSKFEIGKIPTDEMILTNGRIDEDLLHEIREDALGYAIKCDIIDGDELWIDYEFEETQVKVDLADMILADLAEEVLGLELN